jgi:hypothetical protein
VAQAVAITLFDNEARSVAVIIPLFYGFVRPGRAERLTPSHLWARQIEAIIVGVACAIAWRLGWTHAPPTDPLWKVRGAGAELTDDDHSCLCAKVLVNSYQPGAQRLGQQLDDVVVEVTVQ